MYEEEQGVRKNACIKVPFLLHEAGYRVELHKVHIVIHAGYLPDDIIAHTDGIKHRVKTRKTGPDSFKSTHMITSLL